MLDRSPDPNHANPFMPTRQLPFTYPLTNLAAALRNPPAPVKIIAIGSSSTAGRGTTVLPYPYRLEAFLRDYYKDKIPADPNRIINVINRGKGGEDAPEELKRLDRDVLEEKPVMVIWQVGTNAAFKSENLTDVRHAIAAGLDRLKAQERDILLMDPQYVPALIWPDTFRQRAEEVQGLIREAADAAQVNLFGRYELMRAWHQHEKIPLDNLVDPDDPDRLHQSDWSTRRVAWELWNLMTRSVDELWKKADVAAAAKSNPSQSPPSS